MKDFILIKDSISEDIFLTKNIGRVRIDNELLKNENNLYFFEMYLLIDKEWIEVYFKTKRETIASFNEVKRELTGEYEIQNETI